jgi:hypothetical protein
MPVKFLNAHDPKAVRKRQAMLDKIDRWWEAFQARTPDLLAFFQRRKEWDLPGWMEETLQGINKHLMWEFGADKGGGHRLVITPESRKHLRPLVDTILERAPAVAGWRFYPYRQPESLEDAAGTVEARTGADLEGVQVSARVGDFHRVNLLFHSPSYSSEEDEQGLHAAFVAAESLLGEEVLDRWTGVIELTTSARGKRFLPLDRLKDTVDALINSIRDQLPDRPYHELPDPEKGALFKRAPEGADDYPDKTDLFVGVSMFPDLWTDIHNDPAFDSRRYSRWGEKFCYLKIDGSEGLDEEKFADRSEIEDALNHALKADKVGCVIGGGTGLRYSYVDLALTDVVRGNEVIRHVLREGNIPRRTWLLFFDCEWKREWIGVWDETPAPPR